MATLVTKPLETLCQTLFVTQPPKSVVCSICHNVMRDCCVACPKLHSFCRGCITKWRDLSNDRSNAKCPRCNSVLSEEFIPNVDLVGTIDEAHVHCFTRTGRTRTGRPAGEDDDGPAASSSSSSSSSNIAAAASVVTRWKRTIPNVGFVGGRLGEG